MHLLRKILQKCNHIFQNHYTGIFFVTVLPLIFVGFLHYELKHHNKDLIYWQNLLQFMYGELEQFALVLILLVLLMKIIFLCIIVVFNKQTVSWYDELSQLEVKKRYADFLLLRLIADIDQIETKYLWQKNTSDIIALKKFMLAHENMKKSVENFRKDARKLLTPNEEEISLPIEEVYGVLEEEMLYLRRSRFHNTEIAADEHKIKKLVNP